MVTECVVQKLKTEPQTEIAHWKRAQQSWGLVPDLLHA